jgi:hypothetical protein
MDYSYVDQLPCVALKKFLRTDFEKPLAPGYALSVADGNALPDHYIINKKATILFWDKDDTNNKTVVKRTKGDRHNARLAFLTAYFQKHSGLSRCKANRYLAGLKEAE